MSSSFSVSIIGCGYLGLPLAEALIAQGYRVKGSTTNLQKVPVLQKAGIFSFCLRVEDKLVGEDVNEFFDSDIVIITLPFRRNFIDPKEYQKQIETIVAECEKSSKVSFVIFTSSTSVYPDNIPLATEDLVFKPDNPRCGVLLDIENGLLANRKFKATIIRLGGLYGPNRKIGSFLAGQKELSGADKPVNLIHVDDAVGLIKEILRQDAVGEIFNGVSDFHPTRKELYTQAAKHNGLPAPEFLTQAKTVSKIVSNQKVKKVLDYRFFHPDPMQMV